MAKTEDTFVHWGTAKPFRGERRGTKGSIYGRIPQPGGALREVYQKPLGMEQYKEDVRCQMTARFYVGLFNQELYHKGKNCQ